MKIIRIGESNILNEEYSSIFGMTYDGGRGYEGFSYELKPLSFNMEQKTGSPRQTDNYKFNPGDDVKGICLYDEKEHKGKVQFLYWDGSSAKKPKLVYIMDMDTNAIVPLRTSTVKSDRHGYDENPIDGLNHMRINYSTDRFRSPGPLS